LLCPVLFAAAADVAALLELFKQQAARRFPLAVNKRRIEDQLRNAHL
jgi:hypothetical protein